MMDAVMRDIDRSVIENWPMCRHCGYMIDPSANHACESLLPSVCYDTTMVARSVIINGWTFLL